MRPSLLLCVTIFPESESMERSKGRPAFGISQLSPVPPLFAAPAPSRSSRRQRTKTSGETYTEQSHRPPSGTSQLRWNFLSNIVSCHELCHARFVVCPLHSERTVRADKNGSGSEGIWKIQLSWAIEPPKAAGEPGLVFAGGLGDFQFRGWPANRIPAKEHLPSCSRNAQTRLGGGRLRQPRSTLTAASPQATCAMNPSLQTPDSI